SDMGSHCFAQRIQIVAAFEHRNDSSSTGPIGQIHNFFGHLCEITVFKQQPAEGIAPPRVKARRDDYQIWLKAFSNRPECIGKCFSVGPCRCSLRQRDVECRSFTLIESYLVRCAGSRVVGILVCRKVENGRITIKYVLSPVPVMNVPVDYQNAICSVMNLSIASRNCDVVE